jgi:hypothetical protein
VSPRVESGKFARSISIISRPCATVDRIALSNSRISGLGKIHNQLVSCSKLALRYAVGPSMKLSGIGEAPGNSLISAMSSSELFRFPVLMSGSTKIRICRGVRGILMIPIFPCDDTA